MITKVPKLVKKLYPDQIWQIPNAPSKLYLTFDDGPIPEITPWVLEQLQVFNARATFFCIGDNVQKHPDTFRQVLSRGHTIGNHTFHHLNGWKTSVNDYISNTLRCETTINTEGATRPQKLFRPPYGRIISKQARILQKQGYSIVMWDILTRDYNQRLSPQKIIRQVIKHTRGGSILVFHDSLKAERNLKVVLPAVLEHFSSRNFTFEKL